MAKILLTGGAGLVGRTLTPMLRGAHEVRHFETANPGDGLPCIQGDLRDRPALERACSGMDAVIHVAALHGRAWQAAGDETAFDVNFNGTRNVLEAAVRQGIRRVVFTSSIWATGHGPNPPYLPIDENLPREPVELYGLTKALGEKLCRYYAAKFGLSILILRPGGIRPADNYSPGIAGFLFGTVDVRDVARAHVLALESPAGACCEAFIITADSPLCRVAPEDYRRDPAATLDRVIPGATAAVAAGRLKLDPNAEWYSIEKARRVLGYAPEYNFQIV